MPDLGMAWRPESDDDYSQCEMEIYQMNINRKLQKIQRELVEIANYIADETEGMEFRKYLKDPNNFTNKELKEMHDDAVKYRTKIKNRDIRDEVFFRIYKC